MRAYLKMVFVLSNDLGQDDTIFDDRQAPFVLDDASPGPAGGSSKVATVPADGAYHRISFDGITPTWLRIETDTNITIRLNSTDGTSGTEIPVQPIPQTVASPTTGQLLPPQNGPFVMHGLLGAGLDLWVKNQSTNPAIAALVKVAFAG